MSIRPATPDDDAALFALVSAFPTPTPCTSDAYRSMLAAKRADPRSAVLVAAEAERLIGYVSGSARLAFYAGGPTAWVDEIYVIPERRASGVGTLLMAAFERWAVGQQCRGVALATRGAVGFYERLGYEARASYFKKAIG